MAEGRRATNGAKSAVNQGWLFAQPTPTVTLNMPQAPEGLNSRKMTFCFVFGLLESKLFKNEGTRQGCRVSLRDSAPIAGA